MSLGENWKLYCDQSMVCHATIPIPLNLQRCETGDSSGLFAWDFVLVFHKKSHNVIFIRVIHFHRYWLILLIVKWFVSGFKINSFLRPCSGIENSVRNWIRLLDRAYRACGLGRSYVVWNRVSDNDEDIFRLFNTYPENKSSDKVNLSLKRCIVVAKLFLSFFHNKYSSILKKLSDEKQT